MLARPAECSLASGPYGDCITECEWSWWSRANGLGAHPRAAFPVQQRDAQCRAEPSRGSGGPATAARRVLRGVGPPLQLPFLLAGLIDNHTTQTLLGSKLLTHTQVTGYAR